MDICQQVLSRAFATVVESRIRANLPASRIAVAALVLDSPILRDPLAPSSPRISPASVAAYLCVFRAARAEPVRPDTIHAAKECSLTTNAVRKGSTAASFRLTRLRLPVKIFGANLFFIARWDLPIVSCRALATLISYIVSSNAITDAAAGIATAISAVHNHIFTASANRKP